MADVAGGDGVDAAPMAEPASGRIDVPHARQPVNDGRLATDRLAAVVFPGLPSYRFRHRSPAGAVEAAARRPCGRTGWGAGAMTTI